MKKNPNTYLIFFLLAMVIPLLSGTAWANDYGECLDCHGEQDLTMVRDGQEVSVFVDVDQYAGSIHGANGITCDECHSDATDEHPDELADLENVDCSNCHDEAAEKYGGSIHATPKGASCKDCHGIHDILAAANPKSRIYPLNIPATCSNCHADPKVVGEAGAVSSQYEEGQHGISTAKGMIGAAICTDCHNSHNIIDADGANSPVNRNNIVKTCGNCHQGAMNIYADSIHGRSMDEGSEEAPTCSNCHNPHRTLRIDREEFMLRSVENCGNCHHHELATFYASYHGQITDLGFTKMARCATCHGSHDVLPATDPASMISDQRRLQTCQQCHPRATENFIGFAPHLDHSDNEKFPVETAVFGFMTALLINVFLIFSVHTILWGIRAMFEKLKHEAPPHLGNPSGRYFLRFNYYHRITHFLIFTSFMLLALTGLPLKFHDTEWARLLATALGGYEVAGIIHRAMGVVTFGYFAMHLAFVAYLWISGKMKLVDILWGPRSIVPHPQDGVDIANNIKWFLGLGPRPKFGRFTYWEKFDYFAVFWGVALIGFSGLVLWFPEWFSMLLPGMVINLAWIIHADEALLATGFIFLIHFFNTHLRVEKFPLDPVILTGKIDEEEMRHERPVEFALRREDGTLREIETTPPPRWLIVFSRLVGWTFVFIGIALLIVMVSSFFV
ncbi:hypothetical protein ACFLYW_03705 [Thermodesulfobacteriota bacterium]